MVNNKVNRFGIIGQGFVGTAVREGMKNHYEVFTYDIKEEVNDSYPYEESFTDRQNITYTFCNNGSIGHYRRSSLKSLVEDCSIIFLCLPTPMKKSGECDISLLEKVVIDINRIVQEINSLFSRDNLDNPRTILVVKSTVPPGTTDHLNDIFTQGQVIFNPEFLTEANANEDFKNQNRIILGGPRPATTIVKNLYSKTFPQVPIIKTDAKHAEMVKYVTNTFLSTKVAYANEIYQICEKLNIDYDKVIEYSQYDQRLGKSHWSVPGPDGSFGYGGHCVPGSSLVRLDGNDLVPIKNLYDDKESHLNHGRNVLSVNYLINDFDFKSILDITKRRHVGELIQIEFENEKEEIKVFSCTPGHLIPIKRDGVIILLRADDILESDEVFSIDIGVNIK